MQIILHHSAIRSERAQSLDLNHPLAQIQIWHWLSVLPWASYLMSLVHGECCSRGCCFSHPACRTMNGTDNRIMHTVGAHLLLLVREHSTQSAFPSTNASLPNTSNLLVCQEKCLGKSVFLSCHASPQKIQKQMGIVTLFIQCKVQSPPSPILYLIRFIYIKAYLFSKKKYCYKKTWKSFEQVKNTVCKTTDWYQECNSYWAHKCWFPECSR